ncbi:MAG: LPXTG cell wall anchor domain-containing protein [Bacteroidetes bacterium]|nr:LPXTG cell wall anchor domain-containing protein [Bacteroidota bacterium]
MFSMLFFSFVAVILAVFGAFVFFRRKKKGPDSRP